MTELTEPQIIRVGDKPAFAVIPWTEYRKLVSHYVPDESDVFFPQEVVELNVLKGYSLVRAWRESLKLTQNEMADRLGISQPAYRKLEQPNVTLKPDTLQRLATALGVQPEQLTE